MIIFAETSTDYTQNASVNDVLICDCIRTGDRQYRLTAQVFFDGGASEFVDAIVEGYGKDYQFRLPCHVLCLPDGRRLCLPLWLPTRTYTAVRRAVLRYVWRVEGRAWN